MTEQSIYTTFRFRDKNTDEILHQLITRNHSSKLESVKRTIKELTEKFCLPESEIIVEGN
ncbi:hypothetical protein [Pedobacter sp. SYSU D00535]|uniref:hypothetical protein n=1 Tax=Pedobacter sp. SYSU D00535 TaxID=2810308 RepID=UPI001A95F6A6|nr:hypothetical protein [Pedobacter sp. SYSU D00535]